VKKIKGKMGGGEKVLQIPLGVGAFDSAKEYGGKRTIGKGKAEDHVE